ncbi:hypothetical protein [Microbacterium testaceum]|uniref:hypothetical protein n=1 Tax=Microbacterium testaceum TaxID=2033 RepID=UPI002AC5E1E4|nr:hypothetical protein [Microbacterium testaceum]MDZ5145329.1 hypothetical protein [Microbacterium testaceum]
MNKTAVFVTFAALAALGIVGSVVLLIHRPDATATFTAFVVQILGIAAVAAGTFYGFGKTNEKLEAVQKQTNGTLTKRDEEIERLRNRLHENGIDPT